MQRTIAGDDSAAISQIAENASTELPLFFLPDGLEVVVHAQAEGCVRAIAVDASGATRVARRVGGCEEHWVGAVDDLRGWIREDQLLVAKRFNAPTGEVVAEVNELRDVSAVHGLWVERCEAGSCFGGRLTGSTPGEAKFSPSGDIVTRHDAGKGSSFKLASGTLVETGLSIEFWTPHDDGVLALADGTLHWIDSLGSQTVVGPDVANVAVSPVESRVATVLRDGRVIVFSLADMLKARRSQTDRWNERVAWLSDRERAGRLSGGPADMKIMNWLSIELQKAGLEPEQQFFDIPKFRQTKVELSVDGVQVDDGFRALPTTDPARVEGPVGSISLEEPTSASIGLVKDVEAWWPLSAWSRSENSEGVQALFVQTNSLEALSSLDHANVVWESGPPIVAVTPELAARIGAASKVELHVETEAFEAKTSNVWARVRAAEESRGTWILMAHWDHVGAGGFGSLDEFDAIEFPGANDNASGVASVLAAAEHLQRSPLPHHDVVILFTGAEELGLLGARHWVRNAEKPVGVVNFDMMGDLAEGRLFVNEQLPTSWAQKLELAGEDSGWPIHDISPTSESGFSDHRVFSEHYGVPVLFLHRMVEESWHKDEDRGGSLNPAAAIRATHFVVRWMRYLSQPN